MSERSIIEKDLWDRYQTRYKSKPTRKYKSYNSIDALLRKKISVVKLFIRVIGFTLGVFGWYRLAFLILMVAEFIRE